MKSELEPDFKLTESEIHSAAWQRISEHFQARLDAFRKNNDGNLTHEQTTKLRGRIAECTYILGVSEKEPPEAVADYED